MGYLLISYLIIGFVLMLLVPRYLKRRGVDTFDPAKTLPLILMGEEASAVLALLVTVLWPVLIPIWIWSEKSAARENLLFAEKQKAERERMKSDPYANLSFDQKLDALKKIAEERKREPNQPLQRNAGSRPSSDDSSASETPSSVGPRG